MASHRQRLVVSLGSLSAALTCLASNWPSLSATLGPIDDHEVVRWQGRDGVLGLGEALRIFPRIEWGLWGLTARYRPGYFFSRLIEAALLGRHPGWWYMFHTLLQIAVVIALVVVGHAVLRRATEDSPTLALDGTLGVTFHGVCVVAMAVLLAGMPFWNDVVTRLGPSEIYAMVGLAVCVSGIAGVLLGGRGRWWIVAAIGFVGAATSKENFPILLLPLAVIAVHQWREGRHRSLVAASMATMVAASIVVVGSVATYVVSEGHDVYDVSAGRDRWSGAFDHWRAHPWTVAWLVVFLVIVWASLRVLRHVITPGRLFLVAGISVTLPFVRIADSLFTAGNYRSHRYLALQNVCVIAELLVIVMLGVLVLGRTRSGSRVPRIALMLGLVLAPVVPLSTASSALVRRHHVASVNRDQTRAFQLTVDTLAARLKGNDGSQVVFVIDLWSKAEPAVSMSTFLRGRGVADDRVFLRLVRDSSVPPTPGETNVGLIETNGRDFAGIAPISRFSRDAPTVCVFTYRTPIDTEVTECDGAERISFFDGDWWYIADR